MRQFTTDDLAELAEAEGLVFPSNVLAQVVAALDTGKHVMLTGAPGTGKTSLAYVTAKLAKECFRCSGFLATTAGSDWDVGKTIGEYVDDPGGPVLREGFVLQAIETGRWLVIDELNRADLDKALGPLFTVLANQAVTLPIKRIGHTYPLSLVPADHAAPPQTEPIFLPANWRIVATMNQTDKESLYRMSYALIRRFAFVAVESPDDETMARLMGGPTETAVELLGVREFADLGPAVFIDAAKYARRRSQDSGVTRSRVLYETFCDYLLPQLDRLDGGEARHLFDILARSFDAEELNALRRVVRTTLGSSRNPDDPPEDPPRSPGRH